MLGDHVVACDIVQCDDAGQLSVVVPIGECALVGVVTIDKHSIKRSVLRDGSNDEWILTIPKEEFGAVAIVAEVCNNPPQCCLTVVSPPRNARKIYCDAP